jgi:hypothetical protein
LIADDVAGDIFSFGEDAEVSQDKPVEEDNTDGHGEYVEDKVSMVVDADAVVKPRAVMVMLRGATLAHLTVLAA